MKKLEASDCSLLENYLRKADRNICELSLSNLCIWQDYDRPKYAIINGNLCLLIDPPHDHPFFLEPLGGQQTVETIEQLLKESGRLSRLSESCIQALPPQKYKIKCLRDQYDYVYLTKELAELKGKRFDGKRNHIRNFHKHYPDYQYRALTATDRAAALAVFERWFAARKDTQYFTRLAYATQKNALTKAFENYQVLSLFGGAILIDHQLCGFILASRLNPSTADAHFQYVCPERQGITQTLLWEACNKTFPDFPLVNLEQDLGIPGLRKAKLSYHPYKLEKKFEITA